MLYTRQIIYTSMLVHPYCNVFPPKKVFTNKTTTRDETDIESDSNKLTTPFKCPVYYGPLSRKRRRATTAIHP
jgi:hypothetical protein